MSASALRVLAVGRSRHAALSLSCSLALGLLAGGASVALLALSGWFIAMSALAGAGLAAGFSFFYPSAGVQAFAVTRTVLRYAERLTGHSAALRLDAALKEAAFAAAVAAQETRARTGELTHAVTSDAAVAEDALLRVAAPVVTYTGVLAGGCALVAVMVSVPLAAIIMLGGAAAAGLVAAPAWLAGLRPGRALATAEATASQEIIDAVDGLDELLSFGATGLAAGRVTAALGEVERAERRLRALTAVARAGTGTVTGATVLLVAVTAAGAPGNGPVTATALASAAAVTLAALGILQLSAPLAAAARQTGRARHSWKRLATVLADDHADGAGRGDRAAEEATGFGSRAEPGQIVIRDLAADRGRGPLIESLRAAVTPGDTVLITGPSGAGKSTLLEILAGHLPPARGEAAAGGVVIGLPQQPYALRGPLADNLRLARPDAGDEELLAAAGCTGLGAVMGPDALRTAVGAGGRQLSGGEMRRLSLAQAILARPDVLLADEPVTGLDTRAARDVLAGLRRGLPQATLVLALHEQHASLLPWAPDLTIRLHGTGPAADISRPEGRALDIPDRIRTDDLACVLHSRLRTDLEEIT